MALQIEPTEMSALEAVLAVDSVRESLEKEAEHLSTIVADAEVTDTLCPLHLSGPLTVHCSIEVLCVWRGPP